MFSTMFRPVLFVFLISASAVFAQNAAVIRETQVNSETDTAYDVEWSPNGDFLAVLGGFVATIYDDQLQALTPPEGQGEGVNLAWNPAGNRLATVEGFRARQIKLWDWDEQAGEIEPAGSIRITSDQYVVTWSPDGQYLATLNDFRGERTEVTIWDVEAKRSTVARLPYSAALRVLDWRGDRIRSAGVNADGELMLYAIDPASGTATDVLPLPEGVILFAFSPDDELLATATEAGQVTITTLAGDDVLLTFEAAAPPVNVTFSPDGQTLATLSYHRQLQIWDIGAG